MSELTRSTQMIAAEINMIKAQVRQTAVLATIEIGKRLKEAKSLVPYGEWGRWLAENVDYSERTAQNAMALAEEYAMKDPQAIAELDVTKAVMLLAVPALEREAFIAENGVEDMSTRELKAAIARLQEEKEKQQLTIEELLHKAEAAEAVEPDARLLAQVDALNLEVKKRDDMLTALRSERRQTEEKLQKMNQQERAWKADRLRLEQENRGHEKTIQRLQEDLKTASAAPPVITTADSPETLAELEKLRAEKASAALIAAYRAGFEAMKRAVSDMETALAGMDEVNRARYRQATAAALKQIEGRITNA